MITRRLKSNTLSLAGSLLRHPSLGKPFRKAIEHRRLTGKFPSGIKKREKAPFQILVYHRVLPEQDPFAIDAVTVKAFEQHLVMLATVFRLITMEQLVQELEKGEVHLYSVCITFDDGYKDNFDYAFPLLQKYGVTATIFLTTDFIGTGDQLWHDQVLFALQNADTDRLTFNEAGLIDVQLTNIASRRQTAFKILEWLKQFNPEIRDRCIKRLFEICRVYKVNRTRTMLDWNEVKQMSGRGVAFGAHTKTHPILTTINEHQKKCEIADSKAAIEEILDMPVSSFAYPNGKPNDFDERSKQLLKQAGFRCAVTTNAGVNTSDRDRFELFRTIPWDPSPNRLLGRLLYERLTG